MFYPVAKWNAVAFKKVNVPSRNANGILKFTVRSNILLLKELTHLKRHQFPYREAMRANSFELVYCDRR